MIGKNKIIATISLLFLTLMLISYFLSYYLSFPALAISILFLIYLLIRKVIYTSIYPGSNWFWKRGMEANYCKELSLQIYEKNRNLQEFIRLLLDQNPRAINFQVSNFNALINSIIDVYIKLNKKSFHQKRIYKLLLELRDNLKLTKIIVNDAEEFTLFDWLDIRTECTNVTKLVLDSYSKRSAIYKSLSSSFSLESLLRSCFEKKNCLSSFYRWCFNDSLGSLDYMRIDLFTRFKCEQVTIKSKNHSLDCLYILAEQSNGSIVVFCNPNAGYYEFLYFQSDWIEFYVSRGISLFLWNYPGYGKSNGSAHIKKFIDEGISVMEYVKSTYSYNKLGLHGESLGGCVAIHIAQACGCDFLLADRTFSSLSDTILFNFGYLAYCLFKLSCHSDIESIEPYLSLECYKTLSVASFDSVISDLASLKSGVAFKVFNRKKESIGKVYLNKSWNLITPALPWETCENLLNALKVVVDHWNSICDVSTKEEIKGHLRTDQEDDGDNKGLLQRVFNVLQEVEVGGISLAQIPLKTIPKVQIQVWLMVLDLWGGNSYEDISNSLVKHVGELKLLASMIKDTEQKYMWKDIDLIGKILDSIADSFLEKSMKRGEASEDILISTDLKKAGGLIPVGCGHSGYFNLAEQELLTKKLTEAGLIGFS